MKCLMLAPLLFALTGCGAEDQPDQAAAAPVSSEGSKAEKDSVAVANNPQQDEPGQAPHALYVDEEAWLPICDEKMKSVLAYVASDEAFVVCDGNWRPVDIKGKAGKDGVDGKDGETVEVDTTAWLDPFTGKSWVRIASQGRYRDAELSCVGDYRLPTKGEARLAFLHDMATGLPTPASGIWTSTVASDSEYCTQPTLGNFITDTECHAGMTFLIMGIYCVSQ